MVQLPNGKPRQVTAAAGCFSHPDHATVPAQLRTAVRTHSQPTAARVGTELHSHDFKRFSVSTHTMRRPLHHVNPPPPTAQPRRHLQSATKSLRMRGGEASQEYLHVARERGQHSGCNACGHRITFVSSFNSTYRSAHTMRRPLHPALAAVTSLHSGTRVVAGSPSRASRGGARA